MNEDITPIGSTTGQRGYTPPAYTGATSGETAADRIGQKAEPTKESLQSKGEQLKRQAAEKGAAAVADLKTGAQSAAGEAKDYGRSLVQEQKESLADKVQEYASAARAASERLRGDDDPLAGPAERGAAQLERMSNYLRDKQPADLLNDIETLARRRPEIVFGGMFVAGLAAARFFKASSRSSREFEPASYVGSPSYAGTPSGGIAASPDTISTRPSTPTRVGSGVSAGTGGFDDASTSSIPTNPAGSSVSKPVPSSQAILGENLPATQFPTRTTP